MSGSFFIKLDNGTMIVSDYSGVPTIVVYCDQERISFDLTVTETKEMIKFLNKSLTNGRMK